MSVRRQLPSLLSSCCWSCTLCRAVREAGNTLTELLSRWPTDLENEGGLRCSWGLQRATRVGASIRSQESLCKKLSQVKIYRQMRCRMIKWTQPLQNAWNFIKSFPFILRRVFQHTQGWPCLTQEQCCSLPPRWGSICPWETRQLSWFDWWAWQTAWHLYKAANSSPELFIVTGSFCSYITILLSLTVFYQFLVCYKTCNFIFLFNS